MTAALPTSHSPFLVDDGWAAVACATTTPWDASSVEAALRVVGATVGEPEDLVEAVGTSAGLEARA